MKRAVVFLLSATTAAVCLGDSACDSGFGHLASTEQLEVTFEPGGLPANSASSRLPLSFSTPENYSVHIRALKEDGTLDSGFNGYVRLSSKPGNVVTLSGTGTDRRNVLLVNGQASNVGVTLLAGYGDTRIWAEDVGYVPTDIERVCNAGDKCPSWCSPGKPCPPACSNGIDDNGNGVIDSPADPGCYASNDDTEDGGTFTAGVSPTIYYYIPRVADVRGGPEGGNATPFPSQAVNIDMGYRGENQFAFNVVVTRVSSAGFYITDVNEDRPGGGGFGSVYAYNFSAPPNMRQCDRLRSFGGTTSDFYGFTEVNYPTWELEEWDPSARPCGIPEPHTLAQGCSGQKPSTTPDCFTIGSQSQMMSVSAGLVRVATGGATAIAGTNTPQLDAPGTALHIGALIGPGFPTAPSYTPTADATNCDFSGDGKIDRTTGSLELACANACAANVECSEFSNYKAQNQFNLVVQGLDLSGKPTTSVAILGDGSTDAEFDPVQLRGSQLRSFTGTLYYFSGGSQFTIQARCADDIVVDLAASPIPSDTACVHARTILDNSQGSN
jgi:hypothetical protein